MENILLHEEIIAVIKALSDDMFFTVSLDSETYQAELVSTGNIKIGKYMICGWIPFTLEEFQYITENIDDVAELCYKNNILITSIKQPLDSNKTYIQFVSHNKKENNIETVLDIKFSEIPPFLVFYYRDVFYFDEGFSNSVYSFRSSNTTKKCFIFSLMYELNHIYDWLYSNSEEELLRFIYKNYEEYFDDIVKIYKEKYKKGDLNNMILNIKFKEL